MISAADDGGAMALKLGNIAFDCDDVLKVATFWSTVLERPLDRGSSELFASIGGADGDRVQPAWYFAKVPEPKQAKNRVHLDLTTPDPSAVEQLVQLGASVVGEHEVPGGSHRWTVMRDPEGNEFCVAAKSFTGWD
jgi:predicted enzyme related to lactoylglutathione lyase